MAAVSPLCWGPYSLLSLCSGKMLKGISAGEGPSVQSTNTWICLISLPLLDSLEMPSTDDSSDSDLFTSNRSSRSLACSQGAQGQVC